MRAMRWLFISHAIFIKRSQFHFDKFLVGSTGQLGIPFPFPFPPGMANNFSTFYCCRLLLSLPNIVYAFVAAVVVVVVMIGAYFVFELCQDSVSFPLLYWPAPQKDFTRGKKLKGI